VVGCGGRGLKQVADISSARVSVHSQEIDGHWERLVSVWGTDKQLGDALVMLGKRIAQKRVTVPKKKKDGLASSGPGNDDSYSWSSVPLCGLSNAGSPALTTASHSFQ